MASIKPAPTEEELADAQLRIQRRRDEADFERNMERVNSLRPHGAARIAAFRSSEPALSRGPMERAVDPEDLEAQNGGQDEPPAEPQTRRVLVPGLKPKGKTDVPANRDANSVIDTLGKVFVEDDKAVGREKALSNFDTHVMSNLSLLLPFTSQIRQLREMLKGAEPLGGSKNGNGKGDADPFTPLRSWLAGD